jgi:hypothetical protein
MLGPGRRPWFAGWRIRAAAAGVVAVAAAVVVGLNVAPPRPAPRVAVCPAADQGCRARPQLAGPDRLVFVDPTVVVLGRWRCTAQAYPAVLNLRTGAVWMFARWPRPGERETAHLVDQVSGAISLSVRPEGSGCDRLVVVTRHR